MFFLVGHKVISRLTVTLLQCDPIGQNFAIREKNVYKLTNIMITFQCLVVESSIIFVKQTITGEIAGLSSTQIILKLLTNMIKRWHFVQLQLKALWKLS
jgi:hypothetical protein